MSKLSLNYNPFVVVEKAKTKHKIGVVKLKPNNMSEINLDYNPYVAVGTTKKKIKIGILKPKPKQKKNGTKKLDKPDWVKG